MSLLSWFSRKTPSTLPLEQDSSGMGHLDATVPMMPPGNAQQAARQNSKPAPLGPLGSVSSRKTERLERRELLYSVVRECMMRAGVLSASYKFKVLSLDPRGRQYLIMMDLANKSVGDSARLAEIEALIAQQAKARHEILVTAVYWRVNDHVTVGLTRQRPVAHQPSVVPSAAEPVSEPVKPASVVVPFSPPKSTPRYEPLQADEVAAFRKAMAQSVDSPSPNDPGKVVQPIRQALGKHADFEDTELVEPGSPRSPLSTTQYGDLN